MQIFKIWALAHSIFTGVPLKVGIGLQKNKFVAFEVHALFTNTLILCKSRCHGNTTKSNLTNPIQTFNSAPVKLRSKGGNHKNPPNQSEYWVRWCPFFENVLSSKNLKKSKL